MTTSVLDIVFDLERDLDLIDDSSYNVRASVTARVVDSNISRRIDIRVTVDFCIALYHERLISKALRLARVNEGSHSFTCHPHVYPQVE